jgi:hypothetical protein
MTELEKYPRLPRYEPGAKVRVKHGLTVPDFDDIPLGGWSGTIGMVEQVLDRIDYEIDWDQRTLDAMHPVYRKRCERDDLDVETMWLAEEDIEADAGIPVPIEQPTEIKTSPLSEKDQDDRVRMALGLTHDDPLPEISIETLHSYHGYLASHLTFPFTAYGGEEEIGPFSRKRATITVTCLLEPVRGRIGVEDGLLCRCVARGEEIEFPLGEIEVNKKNPNARLISDYAYWFHNWPSQDEYETERAVFRGSGQTESRQPGCRLAAKVVLVGGVGGGLLGATIGSALKALHGAGLAATIGGIPVAIIGALFLGWYGFLFGAVNRLRHGRLTGRLLGLIGGGWVGMVAGLSVVALPWSLLGFFAGLFLGRYVFRRAQQRSVSLRGAFLGTCGGILLSAFRQNQTRATAGALYGSIAGLAVAIGLLVLVVVVGFGMPAVPSGYDEADEDDEHSEEEERDEDDPEGGCGDL